MACLSCFTLTCILGTYLARFMTRQINNMKNNRLCYDEYSRPSVRPAGCYIHLNVGIFLDTINVIEVEVYMMVVLNLLHSFILLSMTLTAISKSQQRAAVETERYNSS